jgi:hypothetical protein
LYTGSNQRAAAKTTHATTISHSSRVIWTCRGPADEELEAPVAGRQVARQDLRRHVAALARPALRRVLQHVHDGQREPRLQLLDLLAEGHALPVAVGVDEHDGPDVPAVGHRPQHADQARDADPAGDQADARALVLVDREHAVRPVDVDRRARLELPDA